MRTRNGRRYALTPALLLGLAACLPARQTAPRFEVASVRPLTQPPGAIHGVNGFVKPGGRFIAPAITLTALVSFAYDLKQPMVELVKAPDWASSRFFEIQAEPGANYPELSPAENRERIRLMLQGLLADRFHLVVHRETRMLPVYDLLPAKGGPKLKAVAAPEPPESPQGSAGGTLAPDGAHLNGHAAAVSAIVGMLSAVLGRPVVDKTGLADNYDFDLTWSAGEDAAPGGQSSPAYMAGLFSALESQLGLEVKAATGPVEVLVVDSVESPSGAN